MPGFIEKLSKEHGYQRTEAKKPVMVTVSDADIRASYRKKHDRCAFATACKRELDVDEAFFGRSTAYLRKGKTITRYLLPPYVQKEIVAFDRNRGMLPGEYRLSAPPPSQTLSGLRSKGAELRGAGRYGASNTRKVDGSKRKKDGSRRVKRVRVAGVRGVWA